MRSFAYSALALVAPLLASAAPLVERQSSAFAADILVLQFAQILELLETQFYSQALEIFVQQDFINAGFVDAQVPIQQFEVIAIDESTHVSILEEEIIALGASPISGCSFDFSSVLTSVSTMASTARVVENLGVAAYLGAASLLTDPSILVAAASIMTVEARHQTVLNLLAGGTGIPQAFDIAFTPGEVLAIAGGFISGCSLSGITALTALEITNQGVVTAGSQLSFSSRAMSSSVDGFFCQMLIGGIPFSISLPFSQCIVPQGINGPVAIYITSDNQPIDANVVQRNLNTVIAGPILTFIDISEDVLSSLARGGSIGSIPSGNNIAPSNGVPSSLTLAAPVPVGTATSLISPSQASVIEGSASAAGASIAVATSSA
ncbi:ferritin-like domain-containing protein [Amylocystis lapponica]|nr:ferritin-like domain-containing protein [Amylocystis lapponica]